MDVIEVFGNSVGERKWGKEGRGGNKREGMCCLAVTHRLSQVIINYPHALTQFAGSLGGWMLCLVILAFLKTNEELSGM